MNIWLCDFIYYMSSTNFVIKLSYNLTYFLLASTNKLGSLVTSIIHVVGPHVPHKWKHYCNHNNGVNNDEDNNNNNNNNNNIFTELPRKQNSLGR